MRIIAGKFRGRVLKSFKASHIRPTTDRVKESIFNKLANHLPGARVLDLFSGTGNLAIEAYSRGASYIEAVEKHPKSISIIRENMRHLQIDEVIQLIHMDVLQYLKNYAGEGFDVILIDPPFTKKMADAVMQSLAESQVTKPKSMVMIESSAHEKIAQDYAGLQWLAQKDFGDKYVNYYTKM